MSFSPNLRITKETFRQIFLDYWAEFQEKHPSYKNKQYESVVQKMLNCGKEGNGYSEYRCKECKKGRRRIAFTCKSSFCLSCAKAYVDNFIKQVSKALHPGVIYRHTVLTVPEQLKTYFYKFRNDKSFLAAFMRCGYECLEALLKDVKRQDIKIGAIIVIQTYGRSGHYNPHLHVMMTNGGINEKAGKWVDLNYFPYEMLHKKWEYYLLNLMKKLVPTEEMNNLVDTLWKMYPNGLVANIKKGKVPEKCRGLAEYLAKYLASPPISVRRIIKCADNSITYWYKDHKTKRKKVETVDVYTFIGRMVQHVFPKGFQRIRYYGLQSTRLFSKWRDVIKEGLKRIGRSLRGVYQVLSTKKYRERYMEVSHKDPMICEYCGAEMELFEIWHPKYGTIYGKLRKKKARKCKSYGKNNQLKIAAAKPVARAVQLSLFSWLYNLSAVS